MAVGISRQQKHPLVPERVLPGLGLAHFSVSQATKPETSPRTRAKSGCTHPPTPPGAISLQQLMVLDGPEETSGKKPHGKQVTA